MSALPTGEELKALPLRAVVAYAHRCAARAARRCLPTSADTGGMPSRFGCGEAVRRALRPAAKIAGGDSVSSRELTAAEDVIVATVARLGRGDDGLSDERSSVERGKSDPEERAVAMTANAAYAALAAASAVADETAGSRAIRGHRAVLSAVTAAEAAAGACPAIRIGIRRDFGLLSRLSLGAFPDPGRGVDVSDDGPLGDLGDDGRRDRPHQDDAFEEEFEEELSADAAAIETAEAPAEEPAAGVAEAPPPAAKTPEPAADPPPPRRIPPELLGASCSLDDPFGADTSLPALMNDPFATSCDLVAWSPSGRSSSGDGEGTPASARTSATLARREAGLAAREAALSNREAGLAEREADLAEREADLAEREADLDDRDAALEERAVALDAATRAVADRTRSAVGELSAARADRQELAEAAAALRQVFARHPILTGPDPAEEMRPERSAGSAVAA